MRIRSAKVLAVAIAAVVISGLSVAAASAFGQTSTGHAQTIAASHRFAGTSALQRTRLQASVPPAVAQAVQQLATFDHSDPANALTRVRLGRSGATTESTVYTFTDDRSNACVVVVALTLFCNPDNGTSVAGLNWSIGGGDASNPDRLIAIYSDQVAGISLTADGASVPVAMANNIAYAEFPASTRQTTMTVTYTDGSTNTVPTNLQAPAGP